MSKAGASTLRINDLGGGLNVYKAASDIDNNQGVYSLNMGFEGNKLTVLPGYSVAFNKDDFPTSSGGIKGLSSYGDLTFVLTGQNLHVMKGDIQLTRVPFTHNSPRYQLVTWYLTSIYIAIIDMSGNDVTEVYKIDPVTGGALPVGFTGLTGSNSHFTCGAYYGGRLLLSGNVLRPSVLYASKTATATSPDDIADFSSTGTSSQVIGDGSARVSGFSTRQNALYVMTTQNVWKSDGSVDATTYNYAFNKETNTGAISQDVITQVEQDVFYFDGFNVRRLSYEANTLALKDAAITEPVFPFLRDLPKNQSQSIASFHYPYYKLWLRDENSLSNSIALCYNVINKAFTIQEGNVISCANTSYDSEQKTILGSFDETKVFKESRNVRAFAEGKIKGEWVSKEFNLGDNSDFKRFYQLETFGRIHPNLTAYVDLIVEGKTVQTRQIVPRSVRLSPTTGSTTFGVTTLGGNGDGEIQMEDFVYRFETFNDGRNFQVRFRTEGYGNLEINGFNLMYKFLKNYPIHY